ATYTNPYKANSGATVPEVQYFETAPYQGFPAIVPFDLQNGWYAAVKQNVPTTSLLGGTGGTAATASYTASGQVQSFYLCNVGPNGIEEFNSLGSGDDVCEGINLGTNQLYSPFPGLVDSSKVAALISQAQSALTQASQQYKDGVT